VVALLPGADAGTPPSGVICGSAADRSAALPGAAAPPTLRAALVRMPRRAPAADADLLLCDGIMRVPAGVTLAVRLALPVLFWLVGPLCQSVSL